MAYAIMRLGKLKTEGDLGAMGRHNERLRQTLNADPDRRGQNERLVGSGDWLADAQARLAEVQGHIRSNAVLGIEHVLAASPEWFERASRDQVQEWIARNMGWLHDTYGARNVVAAVFHADERTPHIQALVVPVTERDKLSAHQFIGGDRTRLVQLQDSYAAAVRELGLQRGVRGSPAEHQSVRDWYAKLEQPAREAAAVARAVQVEAPARVMLNPEAWAERQQERVAAAVRPAVELAVTQAEHYAFRAERAEGNVRVLSDRVGDLEYEARELRERLERQAQEHARERDALRAEVARHERAEVERARAVGLPEVLERLGAERDPADQKQWRLEGERINVTGAKFYNHDRGQGGGGAIDLVMHATGYSFRDAVAWLGAEVGRELAVKAGVEALRSELEASAARERPAFVAPVPEDGRWGQVRAYLTEERGLPGALVDRLHAAGDLYASERGGHTNAVFLSRGEDGTPTGAFVRGVEPGSAYRGLAAGSRRDAGVFGLATPDERDERVEGRESGAIHPTHLIITEAPIDALSAYALRLGREDGHTVCYVSTDGAGPVPHALIREALQGGGRVLVATDNDPAGERLYARIAAAHPEVERYRPALKDLNDDLRRPQEAVRIHEERERAEREREAAERARAEQEARERAHQAELRRIARLGSWDTTEAREAYELYRLARQAGQSEGMATLAAAVELAKRHNGMGAETLSRQLAAGLPRGEGEGRTEEDAERVAREAVRAALAREDVRCERDGRDRGR